MAAQRDEQPEQDRRPEQVELLFHGERPEMPERRRSADGLEVRVLVEDQVPVRDVRQRRGDVGAQARHLVRDGDQREQDDARQQHEHSRQQSPCPAQPEGAQADGSPVGELAQEERCDEVPADDKEDVDAEEAARHDVEVRVVQEDCEHGDRPKAVETAEVAESAEQPAARPAGAGPIAPLRTDSRSSPDARARRSSRRRRPAAPRRPAGLAVSQPFRGGGGSARPSRAVRGSSVPPGRRCRTLIARGASRP